MMHLDNHNITQLCNSSKEVAQSFLQKSNIDLFSPSFLSKQLRKDLSELYEKVYDFFHANEEDLFIFTSSGAEAVAQVIHSCFLEQTCKEGKNHYLSTVIEDGPILMMLKRLEEQNCTVNLLPVNANAQINLQALEKAIGPRTALVSLSWGSRLLGTVQDLQAIAKICEKKQVALHVDISASIGKLDLEFCNLPISYLTVDGALMHSVSSSGALFVKSGFTIHPLIVGDSSQNFLRAGAFDIPSFAAFTEACRQANLFMNHMNLEVARLKAEFEKKVQDRIKGAQILFDRTIKLPNVSVISFSGVQSEYLLYLLHNQQVSASTGGGMMQHLSRLLQECSYSPDVCANSLSFALSRYTTEDEINQLVDILTEVVLKAQSLSKEITV